MSHFSSSESRKALINALVDFYKISFTEAEKFVDSNSVFSWMKEALEYDRKRKQESHSLDNPDINISLQEMEYDQRMGRRG